jgi:hypothetical protein
MSYRQDNWRRQGLTNPRPRAVQEAHPAFHGQRATRCLRTVGISMFGSYPYTDRYRNHRYIRCCIGPFAAGAGVRDCGGVLSQIDRYGADSNSRKSALLAL